MTEKLREAALMAVDALDSDDPTINLRRAAMNLRAALAEPTVKESLIAQRPWVGLTDEEIDEIGRVVIGFNSLSGWENEFGLAIEAKLREKNT